VLEEVTITAYAPSIATAYNGLQRSIRLCQVYMEKLCVLMA
jgi:hypothetical protein